LNQALTGILQHFSSALWLLFKPYWNT